MQSRKEALDYGLAFPDTYVETPFRDTNWQLVRVKCSKKAFLWIYEKDGYVNLNVKADKEWRDYWRSAFKSVIPGWHQNKENWNTIILDGLVRLNLSRGFSAKYNVFENRVQNIRRADSPQRLRIIGSKVFFYL